VRTALVRNRARTTVVRNDAVCIEQAAELVIRVSRRGRRRLPDQHLEQRPPDCSSAGECVSISMPSTSGVVQAATGLAAPFTSTRQSRQLPIGRSRSSWQSVGTTMPAARAAARIVVPSPHSRDRPSIVTRGIGDVKHATAFTGLFGLGRPHQLEARMERPSPTGARNSRCSLTGDARVLAQTQGVTFRSDVKQCIINGEDRIATLEAQSGQKIEKIVGS
jgi:hypothetical protein